MQGKKSSEVAPSVQLQIPLDRYFSLPPPQTKKSKGPSILEGWDPFSKLVEMKSNIAQKMIELDKLNGQYYQKQEKMFLKTFINIMDRMSTELLETQQKYDNIDQEINNHPECLRLRQRLNFYKNQCLVLAGEFKQLQKQHQQIRSRNQEKQAANKGLSQRLMSLAIKQKKYRRRKYSLETRIHHTQGPPSVQKRRPNTQQKLQVSLTRHNTSQDKDRENDRPKTTMGAYPKTAYNQLAFSVNIEDLAIKSRRTNPVSYLRQRKNIKY